MRSCAAALCCVVLPALGAAAPGQRVRLLNEAPVARALWVDVAVPQRDLPDAVQLMPQGFLAVRGRAVGTHSTILHVLARLRAGQRVDGELEELPPGAVLPPFVEPPSVADDLGALIPAVSVDGEDLARRELRLIEQNAARQVWFCRHVGRGFVADSWIHVYSMQDVVPLRCQIVWSDRDSKEYRIPVETVRFQFGEEVHSDFAKAEKFSTADRAITWHPPGGQLGDAELIRFVGALLCRPDDRDGDRADAGAAQNLAAARAGPASGVCLDWDGHWLVFGQVPAKAGGAEQAAHKDAGAFEALLARPGKLDMWSHRPLEGAMASTSTGSQQGFGATKGGVAVTLGDPRLIRRLRYSAAGGMALRPFHHRERDGTRVLAAAHPKLHTWGLMPFKTGQDYIGKPGPWPRSVNGRNGMDDQHANWLNWIALLALTGDYQVESWFLDLVELDLCNARVAQNGMGNDRAVGRMLLNWANESLVLPEDAAEKVRRSMATRLSAVSENWSGGQFVDRPDRTYRVLSWFTDPRGIVDPNTKAPLPSIIPTFNALGVIGLEAMHRVTGDPDARAIATEIARTLVRHCAFEEGGEWILPWMMRYPVGDQEGLPVPESELRLGGPYVKTGGSWWWLWARGAFSIFDDIEPEGGPWKARVRDILRGTAPGAPPSMEAAEWWATGSRAN